MKKSYEKPVLNASMEGTLEGVYAYGNVMAGTRYMPQSSDTNSKNTGCKCVTKYYMFTLYGGKREISYCDYLNYRSCWWVVTWSVTIYC